MPRQEKVSQALSRLLWSLAIAEIPPGYFFLSGYRYPPEWLVNFFFHYWIVVTVASTSGVIAATAWCIHLKRRRIGCFDVALPAVAATLPLLLFGWAIAAVAMFGVPAH